VRLLRVAPVSQAVLDLGPDITSAMAVERGWWRLPESARIEVITLLARLIARGVLVEDPPSQSPTTPATGDPGGSGAGVRGE
jgi:hypothetical protein